jgi:predicted GNAT family N-acyltransferase
MSAPANRSLDVRVVSNAEELMMCFAVRSAVFMAEQDCPYSEEFDGNDYTATHLLGFVDGAPAATFRLRWFAEFVKAERAAVLPSFRGSGIIKPVMAKVFQLSAEKGYRQLYCHSQLRYVDLWAKFGFRPLNDTVFRFSDHEYRELVAPIPPTTRQMRLGLDPLVLNRPENDFDTPGILEESALRPATTPLSPLFRHHGTAAE